MPVGKLSCFHFYGGSKAFPKTGGVSVCTFTHTQLLCASVFGDYRPSVVVRNWVTCRFFLSREIENYFLVLSHWNIGLIQHSTESFGRTKPNRKKFEVTIIMRKRHVLLKWQIGAALVVIRRRVCVTIFKYINYYSYISNFHKLLLLLCFTSSIFI